MHLKAATSTISSKNSAAILSKNSAAILSIVEQRNMMMACPQEKKPKPNQKPNQHKPSAYQGPDTKTNKQRQTTTPIDVRTSNQNFEATSARSSSCLKTSKGVSGKWSVLATARSGSHVTLPIWRSLRRPRRSPRYPPFLGILVCPKREINYESLISGI